MATRYAVTCDECEFDQAFAKLSQANQVLFRHMRSRSHSVAVSRQLAGFARYDVKHCETCEGERPHTSRGVCLACVSRWEAS